jgi:hypothetical protein
VVHFPLFPIPDLLLEHQKVSPFSFTLSLLLEWLCIDRKKKMNSNLRWAGLLKSKRRMWASFRFFVQGPPKLQDGPGGLHVVNEVGVLHVY